MHPSFTFRDSASLHQGNISKTLSFACFVADENIDFRIIAALKAGGYAGITDQEVFEIAKEKKAVILTEDSDFGEWVFAHHHKDVSVVFLRYHPSEIEKMVKSLIVLVESKKEEMASKFVVITPKKLRIRDL